MFRSIMLRPIVSTTFFSATCFFCFLQVAMAPASALLADTVDEFVVSHMTQQKIPGIAIAVTRDGEVIKAQGYGLANVEHGVPAAAFTVFQTGSVGKQFTAAAVMMLVDEGKVALDDPLSKYFKGSPEAWGPITVRHLLTHTSGIPDWYEGQIDYRKDYTEDELEAIAEQLNLDFAPGSQWSYSNTGYVLLGFLIHKISGDFYGDFLQQRLFGPLGMSSTRIITEREIVPHRAGGYFLEDGSLRNQEWVAPQLNTTADGSLYTTVLDLAKWDAALGQKKLLSPVAYQAWWTPVRLNNGATYPYGFGWGLNEQRGFRLIEHGGSWQGFRTAIHRYPEQKLGVIVLSNLAQSDPSYMATKIAGLLEPALALPSSTTASQDPSPKRTASLRALLSAFAEGKTTTMMATGLAGTNAGTPRERAQRKRVGEILAGADLRYLAADEVLGRDIERRGEKIAETLYYGIGGAAEQAKRIFVFYLNAEGRVADFSTKRDE